MAFSLQLSQFQGPLDMLLYLIGKAKVDIKDIFVSQVTKQYIDFVHQASDLDMEDVSGFLQMAATLLEIKSRALIPREKMEEQEEDPQETLIRQLEQYQLIKELATALQHYEGVARQMYQKLPEEYPLPKQTFELKNLTLDALKNAMLKALEKEYALQREEPQITQRKIVKDEHTLPQCMAEILKQLKHKGKLGFATLMGEAPDKEEVVTYFLALLELLRLGRCKVAQDDVYGEIVVSFC